MLQTIVVYVLLGMTLPVTCNLPLGHVTWLWLPRQVGDSAGETNDHDEESRAEIEDKHAFAAAEQDVGFSPVEKPTGVVPVVNEGPSAAKTGTSQAEERSEAKLSDAERITRLQRGIESDLATIAELRRSLEDPHNEYRQAEANFKQLDDELTVLRNAKSTSLGASGASDTQPTGASDLEIAALQTRWNLAKERFDVAIEQRKTTQEKIRTLEEKIQQDQQALRKLSGEPEPDGAPSSARTVAEIVVGAESVTSGPPNPNSEASANQPATNPTTPSQPDTEGKSAVAENIVKPATSLPDISSVMPVPRGDPGSKATGAVAETTSPSTSPAPKFLTPIVTAEVQKAAEVAQVKEQEANQAEEEVKSIVDRIDLLQRNIDLERKLLATSRKKSDLAEDARRVLEAEFRDKLMNGTGRDSLAAVQNELHQAQELLSQARAEAREHATNLDALQSSLTDLMSEQIVLLQAAEGKREAANSAKRRVEQLQNPFSPRNAILWCSTNGSKILAILFAMATLLWLSRVIGRRMVSVMSVAEASDRPDEWENQARTILGVFFNAAKVAILGGGGLMILDTIGVPVTALMGGAAVFGLAVAFGAQSLFKDYFYGFMILLEHQYTVNDVVRIGTVAGQVERITLRTTVLRDLEGRVHFIPHGQITSTTNLTQGWSRAVFELSVAYKENVDQVMQVLAELGRALRTDPEFGPLILDDMNMLGVHALADSGVVLKFFIKTLPLKQWQVKREMLRRIKMRFDELHIEIPFPHRTVYHRPWQENAPVDLGIDLEAKLSLDEWSQKKAA